MANFDPATNELSLRFLLCGPVRAGKSEVLARLKERVGSRNGDESHDLVALPLAIEGAGAVLRLEVIELDPVDDANGATEALMSGADGVAFVADSRRERLRDNLMAYAWLLERLRGAGKSDLLGVLLLNRRDGEEQVGAIELESVVGSGRFPSFTTDALRGDDVVRSLLELLRRGATRAHGELGLDTNGITLPALLLLIDEALTRPAVRPVAVAPIDATEVSDEACAPVRSPLARYAKRLLLEQSSAARELRRMLEQASWIEDEARRPLQFLQSLFAHLGRQGPRLPPTLEEAVAGGTEVVAHLADLLDRRSRLPCDPASATVADSRCDLARIARQAARAAAQEIAPRTLRAETDGAGGCAGDADLLRALLWSLFVAMGRSRRSRRNAPIVARVRVDSEWRALRLRIGRFGPLARGRGIEELALARRLARRLGWRLAFAARRAGSQDLCLEPRELMIGMRSLEPEISASACRP
ncbi:MAG: hypothetical protein EXS13_00385 [Planctomycetes bacterium]|nr:hypothetical protein [Planctomycetota bacterium]